jgi:mannose-6-phosphate isomerase-like protein (cupin superfamily)
MPVALEGDCRVVDLKEGEPAVRGPFRIWEHFRGALSLRVLELDGEAEMTSNSDDETLYVIAGSGSANGTAIERDTGIDLPRGQTLRLAGTMTLLSSLCPAAGPARPVSIARLEDQPRQNTADRWYCELVQGETTQFVGSIPPGRAPDHFHLYEEVLCILDGEGVMWAGHASVPIGPGSCVFLPRKQVHCVENTGPGELRLLGVFYPAGSPAVRYPAT